MASKLRRAKPAAPGVAPAVDRQLIFVIDEHRTTYGPVGAGEKTGTHVVGGWDVTNISDKNFVLLKIRLGNHAPQSGAVGVQIADGGYQVKGTLRAHRMAVLMIELTFTPAIHVPGGNL